MAPNNRPRFGVIVGTGVAGKFKAGAPETVRIRYGEASVFLAKGDEYYFIRRHGPEDGVPPHMVNYRANISALGALGVKKVLALSAVGSMDPKFRVGDIGLLGQFLDFTKHREATFFEEFAAHTDMTHPYSGGLNGGLERTARILGIDLRKGLVYVCVEGPRFETAAEIRMFRALGGDVVGMTGVPEVVLANEMGMEYASVVVATNRAAGMQEKVSHGEVLRVMERTGTRAKELIEATIKRKGAAGMRPA